VQPGLAPYRYAYIVKYLALNFFDATLNGTPRQLARLAPTVLADIEELTYQKQVRQHPAAVAIGTAILPQP
jgi:hypothetical protein